MTASMTRCRSAAPPLSRLRGLLLLGEKNGRFELIAAIMTRPQISKLRVGQTFAPCRGKKRAAALGAGLRLAQAGVNGRAISRQDHGFPPAALLRLRERLQINGLLGSLVPRIRM